MIAFFSFFLFSWHVYQNNKIKYICIGNIERLQTNFNSMGVKTLGTFFSDNIYLNIFWDIHEKSRIRETKHLSTDADSSTDTTVGWTKNTQKPNFF